MSKRTKISRLQSGKRRIPTVVPPAKQPAKQNGTPELPLPEDLSKVSFKIPGVLAQQIVTYLEQKPFKEVFTLLQGLMRCEKMKE